jgi:hypothetical protein
LGPGKKGAANLKENRVKTTTDWASQSCPYSNFGPDSLSTGIEGFNSTSLGYIIIIYTKII